MPAILAKKIVSSRPAIILSWSLALVLIYFGLNEMISPNDWVAFVPGFLGSGGVATFLVIMHGILLCVVALAFVFNYYRRLAAALLTLMLLEIIFSLILESGASDIAIRDIGLLGAALALFFSD